jgi:hypothetical protein
LNCHLAALESLDGDVDINRENKEFSAKEISGYYKFKQYTPWFDERCRKLL